MQQLITARTFHPQFTLDILQWLETGSLHTFHLVCATGLRKHSTIFAEKYK
jgi:hypothetical protein